MSNSTTAMTTTPSRNHEMSRMPGTSAAVERSC